MQDQDGDEQDQPCVMLPVEVINHTCSFLSKRPALRGVGPAHSSNVIQLFKAYSFDSFLDVIHYIMEYEHEERDDPITFPDLSSWNTHMMHVVNVMEQKLCPPFHSSHLYHFQLLPTSTLPLFPRFRYILMRESMSQLDDCAGDVRDILAEACEIAYGHPTQT